MSYNVVYSSFPGDEVRMYYHRQRSPKSVQTGSDCDSLDCSPGGGGGGDGSESELGISTPDSPLTVALISEPTLKSGFGGLPPATKFGLNAKRTLRRVGAIVSERWLPEEVVFLTGTLPGSTDEAFEAIARWSGYIVDRLRSWLYKKTQSAHFFYAWEWQKRGALHLHYAVVVEETQTRLQVIEEFQSEWIRLLDSVSERCGVDLYQRDTTLTWKHLKHKVQCYAQQVRKSVSAYLSKYVGKHYQAHGDECNRYYPSRWWGCSRSLIKEVRLHSFRCAREYVSLATARRLFEEIGGILKSYSLVHYRYKHRAGHCESHVAYGSDLPKKLDLSKEEFYRQMFEVSETGMSPELWTPLALCQIRQCTKTLRANPWHWNKFLRGLPEYELDVLSKALDMDSTFQPVDVDLLILLKSFCEYLNSPISKSLQRRKYHEDNIHNLVESWGVLRGTGSS